MREKPEHNSFCERKMVCEMSMFFALRAQSRMCVSGVKLSESRMVCRGRKRIQTQPAPEKKSIDLLPRPLHLTCPIPHAAPVNHTAVSQNTLAATNSFFAHSHKALFVFFSFCYTSRVSPAGKRLPQPSFWRGNTLSALELASGSFCAGVGHVALFGRETHPLALSDRGRLNEAVQHITFATFSEIGCHFTSDLGVKFSIRFGLCVKWSFIKKNW